MSNKPQTGHDQQQMGNQRSDADQQKGNKQQDQQDQAGKQQQRQGGKSTEKGNMGQPRPDQP